MDRFRYSHRAEVTPLRKEEEAQYKEIEKLKAEKSALTDYKNRGFSIVDAIKSTMDFVSECSSPEKAQLLAMLERYEKAASDKLGVLETLQGTTEARLADVYERPSFKENPYRLFGVWLHAGSMQFGHYRAYLRNLCEGGGWLQFNDERVTQAREEDVLREARGEGSLNAAFVLYVKEETLARWEKEHMSVCGDALINVPDSTVEAINANNGVFKDQQCLTPKKPKLA